MVYPTPGFVVRQTFLEFEGEEAELNNDATGQSEVSTRRRSSSDSDLLRMAKNLTLGSLGAPCWKQRVEEEPIVETIPSCSSSRAGSIDSQGQPDWTTIFLQNLPSTCSRQVVVDMLEWEGFAGSYDFVYVPVDILTMTCSGNGFVNFRTHDVAAQALKQLDGYDRWRHSPGCCEVCRVSWSTFSQGLAAHIERYRNSPVMHDKVADICKPMLFERGVPVPFPAPTKRLRVPRIRGTKSMRGRGAHKGLQGSDRMEYSEEKC